MGLRQVCDIYDDLATFCNDFCRTKKDCMFKTLANRSQCIRGLCDTMQTFRGGLANRFVNKSRTRRIPVR